MARIELAYVQVFKDRHGKPRHYFRRRGFPRMALPGAPGSAAFMAAYQLALEGPTREIGHERVTAGSISALISSYYMSADYIHLKATTKKSYRSTLEAFRKTHGAQPAALIAPKHVNSILDKLAENPGSAIKLRKRLRQIMQHAVDMGWRNDNPVIVSKKIRHKSAGISPWTEDEINRFEARWPSGSKPRLAMSLMLYTGQRKSDAVRMGRQHVTSERISVVQVKTGKVLMIPLHPQLSAELAHHKTDMTFLRTEYGRPFSIDGFGIWFKDKVVLAGITNRTAHGLRKAAGRRLAEAGCTAHEIMSILGHSSMAEAEKYTRDVEQRKMADSAIVKLRGTNVEHPTVNHIVKPG